MTGKKIQITVTDKNVCDFYPYQGSEKLEIGTVLEVVKQNIPYVNKPGTFAIVTDWRPSLDSLNAIKNGSKKDAEFRQSLLNERAEAIWFNRYSISQKIVRKIANKK